MFLISKTKNASGAYPAIINSPTEFESEEFLKFAEEFMSEFYKEGKAAAGFVDIQDDGTSVTSCTWNESAYQNWLATRPNPTQYLSAEVREKRDQLLRDSDWTQIPDSPLNDTEKYLWKQYRQNLRDVPQQSGFPENVIWPEEPK